MSENEPKQVLLCIPVAQNSSLVMYPKSPEGSNRRIFPCSGMLSFHFTAK